MRGAVKELSFPFSIHRDIVRGHDLHFGYWDDTTPTLEDAQKKLTQLMLDHIGGKGLNILDVGCGFGRFAYLLARQGHCVTALAPDAAMIRYAEEHFSHPHLRFLCEAFEDRNPSWWKPESYDLVVFFESSQYFPCLGDLFEACGALLRPQGRMLLCGEMIYDESTAHETAVKPRRLYLMALAEAGFKIRSQKPIGAHTAPTCAAVLERLKTYPMCEGLDALAAGWQRQKQRHEEGAWGYEILEAEKDDYRIMASPQEDDPRLVELFHQVFAASRSLEHWRWKYRACPFGRDAVAVCRDAQGHVVANFSGYFVPVEDTKTTATAMVLQVGDTMTHPRVRQVGFGKTSLLVRTARYFFARWCEIQVPFVYGFNTGNIQKMGKMFLGYRPVYPLDEYILNLQCLPPSVWNRLHYTCRSLRAFGAEHDALYARVKKAYGRFLVVRNSRYLNWRFADPDRNYTLLEVRRRFGPVTAYLVAEKRNGVAVIGDLLLDPAHPGALERALHQLGRTLGVQTVSLWMSQTPSWLTALLSRLGFDRQPEPQGLWFVYVPFQIPLEPEDMEGFYFTRADSDLF